MVSLRQVLFAPLAEARLVYGSVLPGFSIFMFGVTLHILKENSRRAGRETNYKMVSLSVALLIGSTAVCAS